MPVPLQDLPRKDPRALDLAPHPRKFAAAKVSAVDYSLLPDMSFRNQLVGRQGQLLLKQGCR